MDLKRLGSAVRRLRMKRLQLPAALPLFCAALLVLAAPGAARRSPGRPLPQQQGAERLLVRTMTNPAYRPKFFGPVRWVDQGAAYLVLERAPGFPKARDIVRYDTATGERAVLLPASKLIPPGATEPLGISGFSLSSNGRRVLIYTNTSRVWRRNTRGDTGSTISTTARCESSAATLRRPR